VRIIDGVVYLSTVNIVNCLVSYYSGIVCMILAHIPTLSGGSWNEFTGELS
jgi:hypothetical protein